MSKYKKSLIYSVAAIVIFIAGRFSVPVKPMETKEVVKEKIVYIESNEEKKNLKITENKITRPDGTIEETKTTEDKGIVNTNTQFNKDLTLTKTEVNDRLYLGLKAGTVLNSLQRAREDYYLGIQGVKTQGRWAFGFGVDYTPSNSNIRTEGSVMWSF